MAAVLKNPEVLQCIEVEDVDFVETLLFTTQKGQKKVRSDSGLR